MKRSILLIFLLILELTTIVYAWGREDKVLLKEVKVITLRRGDYTAARRSHAIPQVITSQS